MTSMIEKVANAISLHVLEVSLERLTKGRQRDWMLEIAKDAIEAMREPTEVMTNEWNHAHAHLIEVHWRRAIDAALKEPSK